MQRRCDQKTEPPTWTLWDLAQQQLDSATAALDGSPAGHAKVPPGAGEGGDAAAGDPHPDGRRIHH